MQKKKKDYTGTFDLNKEADKLLEEQFMDAMQREIKEVQRERELDSWGYLLPESHTFP